ncbi:MAG: hypothetical protein GY788_08080 [bacterium]|nr:hypothetical protein [bacterium]
MPTGRQVSCPRSAIAESFSHFNHKPDVGKMAAAVLKVRGRDCTLMSVTGRSLQSRTCVQESVYERGIYAGTKGSSVRDPANPELFGPIQGAEDMRTWPHSETPICATIAVGTSWALGSGFD